MGRISNEPAIRRSQCGLQLVASREKHSMAGVGPAGTTWSTYGYDRAGLPAVRSHPRAFDRVVVGTIIRSIRKRA